MNSEKGHYLRFLAVFLTVVALFVCSFAVGGRSSQPCALLHPSVPTLVMQADGLVPPPPPPPPRATNTGAQVSASWA
jgi:hypothetical protein